VYQSLSPTFIPVAFYSPPSPSVALSLPLSPSTVPRRLSQPVVVSKAGVSEYVSACLGLSYLKMEPTLTSADVLNAYTWYTISVDAPEWYVCPIYKTVLSDEEKFGEVCSSTPLTLAPGLAATLQASSPPGLGFFLSLPEVPDDRPVWGVYALILEKANCPFMLYIGSGTRMAGGLRARMLEYDRGLYSQAVQAALDKGYAVTHRGMFCWSPMPDYVQIPTSRLYFVAMEAALTFIFFAATETKLDGAWAEFLPWQRETVAWLPLCTHTALMERPQGIHGMTTEELEAYNLARIARAKERQSGISKRWRAKQRAEDLQGYLARQLRYKIESQRRNWDRVLEIGKGVRDRAIESKKHHCDICDVSLQSKAALAQHLATKRHVEKARVAAGGQPKGVSNEAMKLRDFRKTHRDMGTYRCDTCDINFGLKGHLDQHLVTKRHKKKVARLASHSPNPPTTRVSSQDTTELDTLRQATTPHQVYHASGQSVDMGQTRATLVDKNPTSTTDTIKLGQIPAPQARQRQFSTESLGAGQLSTDSLGARPPSTESVGSRQLSYTIDRQPRLPTGRLSLRQPSRSVDRQPRSSTFSSSLRQTRLTFDKVPKP